MDDREHRELIGSEARRLTRRDFVQTMVGLGLTSAVPRSC